MSVRLFVGNLPYTATEVDIRQHFGAAGDPIQIVIPTDRETGRPRGFAFVDYDDRGIAERAIQQLHGQPFKGRPLSVSEARPREARPPLAGGFPGGPRPTGSGGGFSSPPRPAGSGGFSGAPRSATGGTAPGDGGGFRPRGDYNPNFGPNKPPKGRAASNFAKSRTQEGKAKGPLKERLSGRMFSVDEDARFKDEEDPLGELPLIEEIDVEADTEETERESDE